MLHALTEGRHLQSLARDGQVPKTSLACAPSDIQVASGAQDGSVHVWDGYTGSSTGVYQLHEVSLPHSSSMGVCLDLSTTRGHILFSKTVDGARLDCSSLGSSDVTGMPYQQLLLPSGQAHTPVHVRPPA